jgi:hypothetical protein
LACAAVFPAVVSAQGLDLGDITAGGDGTGTANPAVVGIHPDTGVLDTAFNDAPIGIGDGMALTAVDNAASPFIDAVFLIATASMPINSAGVTFEFPPQDLLDPPQTWGQILKDRIGGELTPIAIGGTAFEHGVGIHAVAGITYDLDALRAAHGEDAVGEVRAFAGKGDSAFPDCAPGMVTTYVILSDDAQVLDAASHRTSSGGRQIRLPIPPEAKFLTLAVGAGNGMFFCNGAAFGGAVIDEARKVPSLSPRAAPWFALVLLAGGALVLLRRATHLTTVRRASSSIA